MPVATPLGPVAQPTRIVIVGGGAAGAITAAHLLRDAGPGRPLDVRVVEPSDEVGPGLPYRPGNPLHLLNNVAGRLSALEGDPDHLLRWCAENGVAAEPTSFLPRATYGRYLTHVFDSVVVPCGSRLTHVQGTVSEVAGEAGRYTVRLEGGRPLGADVVVLALGTPPPRRLEELASLGSQYVDDPWAPGLQRRAAHAREVLLVGTGLTMVDVAVTLHAAAPSMQLTAASRRGLLPAAHLFSGHRLHDVFDPGTRTLDALLHAVRTRVAEVEEVGGDWRDVVDSLRARANRLWRDLPEQDQDRFVVEVARRWEVSRHRMAPEMARRIEDLRQRRVLGVTCTAEVDPDRFDLVVNCTGPRPVQSRGWNPLVDALLDAGRIRAHRLGLGLDLDADGRAVDANGVIDPGLFVVGAGRRGLDWEVAAIPDLRTQAAALTEVVLASRGQLRHAVGHD